MKKTKEKKAKNRTEKKSDNRLPFGNSIVDVIEREKMLAESHRDTAGDRAFAAVMSNR